MSTSSPGAQEVLRVIRERHRCGSRPGERADGLLVALAIEGGGMRGTISGGMALAIHELGLLPAFDDVYGASAGAINGAWLVSRTPESLIGWAEPSYAKMLIRPTNPLRRRPLVDLRSLVEVVYTVHSPMDLQSILDSAVPWHPLATCVETGAAVDLRPYLRQADDVQLAIRASAAMPVLAGGPIGLGGRHFYDGGVAEPIPYRTAMGQGATHVLVLRSRRRDDIPKVSRTTPLFARAALRRYGPELEHAYNHGPTRHAEDDALLDGMTPNAAPGVALASIRPAPGSPRVGRLASEGGLLEEAFEAGRAAVRAVFARMPAATQGTRPAH